MDIRLIFTLALLLLFSGTDAQGDDSFTECPFFESPELRWSYGGDDGPSHWPESYPECGGDSQSPVNIDTANTAANYSWNAFSFQNYDVVPDSMKISNNGHTVQVSAAMSSPATLSGGGLVGEYTFQQLHFHWGSHDALGSEHKLNGNTYPNELHLVHFKTSDGTTDLQQADGVAVLGIFLEINAESNPKLDSIIDGLSSVKVAHSEASITPFALRDLLPDNRNDFYRYMGSLTTPPCNETVIWTVFNEPVTISEQQMNKFRHLLFDDGLKMVDNFRPEQPLNGRTVYHAILT